MQVSAGASSDAEDLGYVTRRRSGSCRICIRPLAGRRKIMAHSLPPLLRSPREAMGRSDCLHENDMRAEVKARFLQPPRRAGLFARTRRERRAATARSGAKPARAGDGAPDWDSAISRRGAGSRRTSFAPCDTSPRKQPKPRIKCPPFTT
jgi:hypothetical protein